VFTQFAPLFQLYTQYGQKHEGAVAQLWSGKYKDFILGLESALRDDPLFQSFHSLLILPIQRVPRYELLLKELENKTEKNHPDILPLRSAIAEVSES